MKNTLKKIFYSFVWLMVLVFVVDIITKWVAQNNLELNKSIPFIGDFMHLCLTHNTGASFGMGSDGSVGTRIIWIVVSVVLGGGLIVYYIKAYKKLSVSYKVALSLMIGGAIGNLIDRAFYWKATVGFDGVIDMLEFPWVKFAVFNVADACLVIGVILLFVVLIIELIKQLISENKKGKFSTPPAEYEKKQAESKNENIQDK